MANKLPPPLPQKNLRLAATLNFFFPGAGLFYLGERTQGAILATAFLICLVSVLSIFLIGYARYLNIALGADIMQEGRLEQIGTVFHPRWLVGLAIAGTVIHLVSMGAFSVVKRKLQAKN